MSSSGINDYELNKTMRSKRCARVWSTHRSGRVKYFRNLFFVCWNIYTVRYSDPLRDVQFTMFCFVVYYEYFSWMSCLRDFIRL